MRRSLNCTGPLLTGLLILIVLGAHPTFATPWNQPQGKQGRSLVLGGIQPCSGLPPQRVRARPRYAAGTVSVLAGRLSWGPWRHGTRALIYPRHIVAQQTVRVNAMYRFALLPGHYVLTARLPHANVRPFVQIVVREGTTVHADIPNMCM